MIRTFRYPEGLVEVIDDSRDDALIDALQQTVERLQRRRPRVIDLQPVAVIDLGSRPLPRTTRERRRRAKRRRS